MVASCLKSSERQAHEPGELILRNGRDRIALRDALAAKWDWFFFSKRMVPDAKCYAAEKETATHVVSGQLGGALT